MAGVTAGKRELVLICLAEALRDRSRFPGDWAALVTLGLQFGGSFDLDRADFDAVRAMTVEEFATAVIDERIAGGAR
jgi:hypothetical protein